MPARCKHKTKKEQREASLQRFKTYYQKNREVILAKKQVAYKKAATQNWKLRKQEIDERKRDMWETKSQTENKVDSVKQLRLLEENINQELLNSGSQYLERLFAEYLAWTQLPSETDVSPLELAFKVFSSMLDAVAKIGNAILNEYGAYGEWKECQRLTRRIRCFIHCMNEWETTYLENQTQGKGGGTLEDLYSKAKLAFQGPLTKEWLDRVSVKRYIAALDKQYDI
ncbi:hypothetical protein PQX77_003628 [Marasmius sp. AFHP31]|nr:hypothetical protein PQX77_003628 [Marasmius sp. AFHP31]